MKKRDLPYMPWYWGDWLKAPEIRVLSPMARLLWFEMIGLMWESTDRGYLKINGYPIGKKELLACVGFGEDLLEVCLAELETYKVFSRTSDGVIFSRKMVHEREISEKRAISGRMGGICSKKTKAKLKAKVEQRLDIENEIKIKKRRKKDILFTTEDSPMKAAHGFFKILKQYNDDISEPDFQLWARDFDKINRIDGKTWEEVKKKIDQVAKHDFWHKVILSPGKLRDHWKKGTIANLN